MPTYFQKDNGVITAVLTASKAPELLPKDRVFVEATEQEIDAYFASLVPPPAVSKLDDISLDLKAIRAKVGA